MMCLGLTVPAFAAESKWKVEVPGKTDAEVFVGEKTFTVRDWDWDWHDSESGDMIINMIRTDSRQLTAENLCVMSKGDTAVFTYKYEVSTSHGGVHGSSISSSHFTLIAWSDPDGDGVYDKRTIIQGANDNKKNGYYEFLWENCFEEVLPAGIDVTAGIDESNIFSISLERQTRWLASVIPDEEARYEARLSADRVLELFGPNTLVGIDNESISTSDPADMEWFILVEGDTSQPTGGPQVSGWAKEQVSRAAENGLVPDGLGNNYQANITRSEFAATAVKLYEAMSGQKAPAAGESPFTDTSDPAVIQAEALGIVSGVGNNQFGPQGNASIEQALVIALRMFDNLK